jgi:hypothetical protein
VILGSYVASNLVATIGKSEQLDEISPRSNVFVVDYVSAI